EALMLMEKNTVIFEAAIKEAARKGAHIIMTPEDSIYRWVFTRKTIYPYLEDIPDPQGDWILFAPSPVLERLSCLARNNSIYMVANMGEKKPCNSSDPRCLSHGPSQYNTNVVFDSGNWWLVTTRFQVDTILFPAAWVNTHWLSPIQFHSVWAMGMGVNFLSANMHSSTFDMTGTGIYASDGPRAYYYNTEMDNGHLLMVEKQQDEIYVLGAFNGLHVLEGQCYLQVDTVLFPTAWMNVLPFLTAIEFHSAWAMGMRVNLLSANTHNTSKAMTGSGLFTPEGPAAYHYDSATEEGRLLLAELSTHPRLSPTYPPAINWSSHATSIKKFPGENDTFSGAVRRDIFTFSELRHKDGNCTVCQGDLCCHLVYQMSNKSEDEVYVLGAFDGLHGSLIKYHWQICSLLKCPSTNLSTCGQPVETAQTKFEMFSLSGTFGTSYVFPEVLYSGVQLAPGEFEVMGHPGADCCKVFHAAELKTALPAKSHPRTAFFGSADCNPRGQI
ncbi:Vascular non-inflammatory molecule 2, partial [Lamprotornis superbus]